MTRRSGRCCPLPDPKPLPSSAPAVTFTRHPHTCLEGRPGSLARSAPARPSPELPRSRLDLRTKSHLSTRTRRRASSLSGSRQLLFNNTRRSMVRSCSMLPEPHSGFARYVIRSFGEQASAYVSPSRIREPRATRCAHAALSYETRVLPYAHADRRYTLGSVGDREW